MWCGAIAISDVPDWSWLWLEREPFCLVMSILFLWVFCVVCLVRYGTYDTGIRYLIFRERKHVAHPIVCMLLLSMVWYGMPVTAVVGVVLLYCKRMVSYLFVGAMRLGFYVLCRVLCRIVHVHDAFSFGYVRL